MSSVSEAIGKGLTVEHGGRSYDLAPVDHVDVIAGYQDHLRHRSLQEVDAARRLMGPLAGTMAMDAHHRLGVAGQFDFGSELWLDSINTQVNQKALVFLALRAKDRSVTKTLAEQIYRDCTDQLVRLIWGEAAPAPDGGDPGNG